MSDLALSTLVDWTRRKAGDSIQTATQTTTSDGTGLVTIKATGTITVVQVLVGVVTVSNTTYSLVGNVLRLTAAPSRGQKITIVYTFCRYSDDQVADFLSDSARGLAGSLKTQWSVDNGGIVSDPDGVHQLTTDIGDIRPEIEELIVLRASMELFADKANQAADNAIKIKDGDTAIDTAATSAASEKAATRLVNQYKDALKKVLSEGFVGMTLDLELLPPRFQVFYNTYRVS